MNKKGDIFEITFGVFIALVIIFILGTLYFMTIYEPTYSKNNYCKLFGYEGYKYENRNLDDYDFFCKNKKQYLNNNRNHNTEQNKTLFVMDKTYQEYKNFTIYMNKKGD